MKAARISHLSMTLALVGACGLAFSGCARQPLVVPAPGAVQGGISRVKAGATTAEQQRQEALRLNQEARAKQQRIDNKDAVIEGYRKWKAQQP